MFLLLMLLVCLVLLLLLLLLVSCMQMFDSVALLFRSVPFGLALGRRIWRWRASARTRVPENHLPLLPGVVALVVERKVTLPYCVF